MYFYSKYSIIYNINKINWRLKMKLYVWKSKAFADYGYGNIIVMASSIKAARNKAMKQFGDNYSNGYYKDSVIEDVAENPEVIDSGCIAIMGSA